MRPVLRRVCRLLPLLLLVIAGCQQSADREPAIKTSSSSQTGKTIPPGFDFSLLDHADNFHQLSRYRNSKAVVLISHGIGCPIVRHSVQTINKLQDDYRDRGITVLAINPFNQDTRDNIKQEVDEYALKVPVLLDKSQFVSWSLGFTRTAEVVVIDTQQWRILYRGPLDDRMDYQAQKNTPDKQHLRDFLDKLLADNSTDPIELPFKGCAITYDNSFYDNRYTYNDHAASILQQRCATCHSLGGMAPWAMTDYETVKNWSFMMREVIKTHRMPPWPADDPAGTLANSHALAAEEERTLLLWLNNGSPRGQGEDPLKTNARTPTQASPTQAWPLGTPDRVLDTGELKTPATGALPYREITLDINNPNDLYIGAVHLRTTNKRFLHHGFAFLLPSADYQREYQRKSKQLYVSSWNQGVFATYAPGLNGEINPAGVVRFIPAYSQLKLQLHLVTTGKEEAGEVMIGLYFTTPKPGDKHYQMDGIFDTWIRIPPETANWPVQASMKFDTNATLYEMMPHMHLRGKSMRYTLMYPDGREQLLLSVPRFDFNWQFQYQLKEPVKIPAGATLRVDGSFDNSIDNPFNPDPQQTVGFGEQTTDEMFIGYITYTKEG